MAAKVRMAGIQGDYPEAEVLYRKLVRLLEQNYKDDLAAHPAWLAEAALEVRSWEAALEYAAGNAAAHPNEARASLLHAKTLVKAAEFQRLCSEVGCTAAAPGETVLDEEHQNVFDAAIQQASKLVNAGEIGRWQARGRLLTCPQRRQAGSWQQCHPMQTMWPH